jgi:hypothetical protein
MIIKISGEPERLVEKLAELRGQTAQEMVEAAISIYAIGMVYVQEGATLNWEKDGEKRQLLIPGLTDVPQVPSLKDYVR